MKVIKLNLPEDLTKWDAFLATHPKGSHLLLSVWLQSYKSYGFDYDIVALLDDDENIIAGYGAVLVKFFIFRFYILPYGPVFLKEEHFRLLVSEMKKNAKKHGCAAIQFVMPFSDTKEVSSYVYDFDAFKEDLKPFSIGKPIALLYAAYGMNWVGFGAFTSEEHLLQSFTHQVRRNIKLAYKNNPQLLFAHTEDEIENAYSMIEQNAKEGGYAVRTYEDFRGSLVDGISQGYLHLLMAKIEGEIKGVALVADVGQRITYISGGTSKEKPDLKMGYFLHFETMKLALSKGYLGYDISMGGSKGVQEFKAKFVTHKIVFQNSNYYITCDSLKLKIYLYLQGFLKKNKAKISQLIKMFKRT